MSEEIIPKDASEMTPEKIIEDELPKYFEDTYGMDTGQMSSFLQTYAGRQMMIEKVAGDSTSDQDLGNNFKEWERMTGNILKVQIHDMLVNLFNYKNVPPTLNTAQLETMLRQFGGGVCVGKDDLGDLVILGRADELGLNTYGTVVPSFFDNENNFMTNKKVITNRNLTGDYVVFYNKQSFSDFYSTDWRIVDHYANLLATIKATERMNILQMRSPYLFKGQKNGVNARIIMSKIYGGDLAIEMDQDFEMDGKLQKIDLNVQDRTGSLQQAYRNAFNEMLTLFGVYNNPEMKKERMISGEASANNHIIEGMGDIYFNARRHAVDLLNSAFGTEIEVEWNSTVATMFRQLANAKNMNAA